MTPTSAVIEAKVAGMVVDAFAPASSASAGARAGIRHDLVARRVIAETTVIPTGPPTLVAP